MIRGVYSKTEVGAVQKKQKAEIKFTKLPNLEKRRIAIKEMLHPRNMSELRTFLGMINHLNKLATRMNDKTKPLHDFLSTKASCAGKLFKRRSFRR